MISSIIKNIFLFAFCLLFNVLIVGANSNIDSLIDNKKIQDRTDYTNINNILNSYNILSENNFALENKERVYVFISFSMPDSLIKEYFAESQNLKQKQNIDIVFALRGFYKSSFRETTQKIAQLTQNNDNKTLGIIVDPTLFQKYNIQQVLVVVKEYRDENYDKISGSTTLRYALNQFMEGKND